MYISEADAKLNEGEKSKPFFDFLYVPLALRVQVPLLLTVHFLVTQRTNNHARFQIFFRRFIVKTTSFASDECRSIRPKIAFKINVSFTHGKATSSTRTRRCHKLILPLHHFTFVSWLQHMFVYLLFIVKTQFTQTTSKHGSIRIEESLM